MLYPVSAFWRISDGWTQWIRRRRAPSLKSGLPNKAGPSWWKRGGSVSTQIGPWPPPAAGVIAVLVLAARAGAGLAAAGLAAAAEVFGLNKSPRLNLAGDADAAGLAAVAASFFLLARFALGEAAGDAEVAGDAAVWADDVV